MRIKAAWNNGYLMCICFNDPQSPQGFTSFSIASVYAQMEAGMEGKMFNRFEECIDWFVVIENAILN